MNHHADLRPACAPPIEKRAILLYLQIKRSDPGDSVDPQSPLSYFLKQVPFCSQLLQIFSTLPE